MTGEVISAGVDWITVTTATIEGGMRLSSWANDLSHVQLISGFLRKPWGMSGFAGYSYGPLQLARRDEECMVRLSSNLAAIHWRNAYRLAENVTRFDVQVTYREDSDARARIRRHHKQALSYSKKMQRGPSVVLITGSDGSDTVYLGKRTSEKYGRIYNKAIESKLAQFAGCVRYEVEFKGSYAKRFARAAHKSRSDESVVLPGVVQFFNKRGVPCPFRSDIGLSIETSQIVTDLRKRLQWLSKQCSPSVKLLIDAGMREEVLKALGISDETPEVSSAIN